MKHYTYKEWLMYVRDEMNERTREELEEHLYTCDQCLELYMQAVSANEASLPTLDQSDHFTDKVMAATVSGTVVDKLPIVQAVQTVPDTKNDTKKKPFYQQAVFHYLLAAAATILLMFSGAFQSILNYGESFDGTTTAQTQMKEKRPSVTEGVINKTFAWMDSLEKKEAVKK